MNIRTVEQLELAIAGDVAWRKKELSEIKTIVQSNQTSSIRRRALISGGIALLYAHWEGFVKNTSQKYLEYVLSRRLTYRQLSSNFVAIAMKSSLNQVAQSGKASVFIPVCDFLMYNLDQRCRFSSDNLINTKSNLNSSVLKEIMLSLGLDYSFFETKEKFIDIHLVECRNIIAHGNYLLVEKDDFLDRFDRVLIMLEYYRNQIENAAINEQYRHREIDAIVT